MVDGIIYVAGHGRYMSVPRQNGVPIVLAYAYANDPEVPCTVIDDKDAAYQMMRYLLSMGHTRIGIIAGVSDNTHTRLRLEGCQKALFEAGILYDPGLVLNSTWDKEGGYRAMGSLMEQGITAAFCMNDRMAGGAYQYCYERGLSVGEDISIAGFDDEIIAEYMTPELTTMAIPLQEFGSKAVEQLLELIGRASQDAKADEPESPREVLLPCMLKIRKSVANLKVKR